jgi:transposase
MRKILTKEQQAQIIEQYQAGNGSDTIAKQFDIHSNSVLKVLKRNNIDRRPFKRKIAIIEFPTIIELYNGGLSAPKIAEKYDVSHSVILKILEKQGCDRRDADNTHRKYAIKEDYFDAIDTPEKAYILGFTYADGCNQKDANYINYDISLKDLDILNKIAERIYIDNPHERVRNYVREKNYQGNRKEFHYSVLSINSKHICDVLDKLGCSPRKSLTVKFPEWLTDKELQRHFIRGYYDGDGGIFISNIKGRGANCKTVGTHDFIQDIINITISNLDINIYVHMFHKQLSRMDISGNQQVKKFLDWIYQGSTIHLDRKYKLYQELLYKMKSNTRTRQ